MKFIQCRILIILGMALQSLCFGASQSPSEDIAIRVKTLWLNKNLTELKTYLSGIETAYPNFVPAILASAFYDYIFLGKINNAKQKLLRIKSVAETSPKVYSDDFKISLTAMIR